MKHAASWFHCGVLISCIHNARTIMATIRRTATEGTHITVHSNVSCMTWNLQNANEFKLPHAVPSSKPAYPIDRQSCPAANELDLRRVLCLTAGSLTGWCTDDRKAFGERWCIWSLCVKWILLPSWHSETWFNHNNQLQPHNWHRRCFRDAGQQSDSLGLYVSYWCSSPLCPIVLSWFLDLFCWRSWFRYVGHVSHFGWRWAEKQLTCDVVFVPECWTIRHLGCFRLCSPSHSGQLHDNFQILAPIVLRTWIYSLQCLFESLDHFQMQKRRVHYTTDGLDSLIAWNSVTAMVLLPCCNSNWPWQETCWLECYSDNFSSVQHTRHAVVYALAVGVLRIADVGARETFWDQKLHLDLKFP